MKQSKTFSLQNQKKIPLQDNHRFPETCTRLLKARGEAMESKWAGCQQIHNLGNIYITNP